MNSLVCDDELLLDVADTRSSYSYSYSSSEFESDGGGIEVVYRPSEQAVRDALDELQSSALVLKAWCNHEIMQQRSLDGSLYSIVADICDRLKNTATRVTEATRVASPYAVECSWQDTLADLPALDQFAPANFLFPALRVASTLMKSYDPSQLSAQEAVRHLARLNELEAQSSVVRTRLGERLGELANYPVRASRFE